MTVHASTPSSGYPPAHGTRGDSVLAPRALTYLNVREGVTTVLVTTALAVAIAFLPDPGWRTALWVIVGILAVVSLLIELPWLNRKQVENTSYTATADYVYITRGWLWRRTTVIATAQILNVEVVQGPLLRAFDAVSVRFTCISEVEGLGPLEPRAAERIRTTVLQAQAEPAR
ncbi:PH domain-containing protein [Microbacterium sp. LMI1x-1-1.1]|uniref:PH domain-containing protein n=1 Tax=Microbacterium sp. LMI1x-1-1.1 TaxID=3135246 RepID=UPI0034372EF8